MAERSVTQTWAMRLLYVAVCGVVIMFYLLPLGQDGWITFSPDLVLGITLAWVIRRPDYAPILLVAAVALLADLLLMRVPGLWAALVVLLANRFAQQRHRMRSTGFGLEWLRVSTGIAAIFVAERVAMTVLLLDTPSLTLNAAQYLATVAVYPLIVAITAGVFRIRKPALIDTTASGRRA